MAAIAEGIANEVGVEAFVRESDRRIDGKELDWTFGQEPS